MERDVLGSGVATSAFGRGGFTAGVLQGKDKIHGMHLISWHSISKQSPATSICCVLTPSLRLHDLKQPL